MKKIIPTTLIALLLLSGLFMAFSDTSESDFLAQLSASNTVIASQTACIDDLETSLYEFSYEISHLRIQNEFLLGENENLRVELGNQAQRAADLRAKMLHLEVKNYDVKRQLEQIIIGRELRARQQSNTTRNIEIAGLMPTPTADIDESNNAIAIQEMQDMQTELKSIEAEMKAHEEILETINTQNKETIAAIAANEAKIQFNIDMEPASDLAVPFADPLVNQGVLFPEETEGPKLFTQISLDNGDIAAVDMKDEFSSKSPIYSLVENTNVVYNYIACRSDRYGKKIKKLRNNGRNWKYTFIQFNLETDNINLLLNKEFRMRVLSTDLNTYVNFNTDKKVKTVSHYDFTYEGEAVKLSLFNKDIKGESFEIQIFHIVDGQEYLLEDDQQALFTDGVSVLEKMTLNN